jgi:hypothetical protein
VRLLERDRKWSMLALACIAFAYGSLVQGIGSNQNGQYALVKSLASGTAVADSTRYEVGDLGTADVSWYSGHYYIAKAPGLAAASLAPYLTLRALGARTWGDPTNMLWALGLFTVVLPVFILLLLVRALADEVAPGLGTAAAATLGLGTLLLPFGTMFFAHALSAMLGFAAFAILWRERRSQPRWSSLVAAGVLVGLAATVEYPFGVIGLALLIMVAARRSRLRRVAVYCVALGLTVSSLFAFNWWAFGNALHFPYNGLIDVPGRSGHDRVQHYALGGISAPSFRSAIQLIFADWGLLIMSPVLAAAGYGVVILYRQALRVEAVTIAVISIFTLLYTSGTVRTYADVAPGPRYLIAMLPFLTVALAGAFREQPLTTAALATGSALVFVAVTGSRPMKAWDGHVLDRLTSRDGYSPTIADLVGVTGPSHIAPYGFAVVGGVVCVALATRVQIAPAEIPIAVTAVIGWLMSAWLAPPLEHLRTFGQAAQSLALPIVAIALTVSAGYLARPAGPFSQPLRS